MKKQLTMLAAVILAAAISHPARGHQLYDDFRDRVIDPQLWSNPGGVCFARGTRECVRQETGARLRFALRHHGLTNSDEGSDFDTQELLFADPEPIDSIWARVVVRGLEVVGCEANPDPGGAQLLISGNFFNTGSGEPRDDVEALLLLASDASDPDRVNVVALLQTRGEFFAFADVTTIRVGQKATISMQWDAEGNQFLFYVRPKRGAATEVTVPYNLGDSDPPAVPFKTIGVRTFPSSCTDGSSVAGIEARVLKVWVNE